MDKLQLLHWIDFDHQKHSSIALQSDRLLVHFNYDSLTICKLSGIKDLIKKGHSMQKAPQQANNYWYSLTVFFKTKSITIQPKTAASCPGLHAPDYGNGTKISLYSLETV